jgi:hypothetical protein
LNWGLHCWLVQQCYSIQAKLLRINVISSAGFRR